MFEHHTHSGARPTQHTAWVGPLVIALVIGLAFVAVYVGLQRDPEPRHLPVAVVGVPLAGAVRSALGETADVVTVTSIDQGRRLVNDGQVVGILAARSPSQLQFDYAGARGLSESGAARQLIAGFAHAGNLTTQERDIVPLVRFDSRGLVTFYVVFGVTLSSFILAQALSGVAARVRLQHRLLVLGAFTIVIGSTAAVLAGPVYGAVAVPVPELIVTLVLLSAASAFITKALMSWLGPVGIGLAVLMLTVAGNATSGASIGVHLLPTWAQVMSEALPQGAAVRALTAAGYFGGGSTVWWAALVLLAWASMGFALVLLRHARPKDDRPRRATRAGVHAVSR